MKLNRRIYESKNKEITLACYYLKSSKYYILYCNPFWLEKKLFINYYNDSKAYFKAKKEALLSLNNFSILHNINLSALNYISSSYEYKNYHIFLFPKKQLWSLAGNNAVTFNKRKDILNYIDNL